jgi:hypothetical protein
MKEVLERYGKCSPWLNRGLTDDDYTEEGKEIQAKIEESVPVGFQNLDRWEGDVRKIGFQAMREMLKR